MKLVYALSLHLTLAVFAVFGLPSAKAAPTPTPAPKSAPAADEKIDPELYFHIGENVQASSLWSYFRALGEKIPARFDEFDAMLKKANAPADVVQDVDRYKALIVKMPWSKTWDQWSDAEKKSWTDATITYTVFRTWVLTGNFDRAFFYYLGNNVLDSWYNIEKSVADGTQTLAAMSARAKTTLDSFGTIATDNGYTHARATLSPEAAQELKDLSALKGDTDDPMGGGVTQEVITKMATAAKTLRDLARANKLTTAGATAPAK